MKFTTLPLLLLFASTILCLFTSSAALGVNYGMIADNLPSPNEVANFVKTKTIFDSVKIFDVNPNVLKAFANTDISVTVTVPNGDIPSLTQIRAARKWVNTNIKPFYPQTKIKYITVGNEVILSTPEHINNLVPAMKVLNRALIKAGLGSIKVTTAHALNLFDGDSLPSLARFRRDYAKSVFAPLLLFHRRTKSPFMVNPYPYFELNASGNKLDFALFRGNNPGLFDQHSGKTYTNAFDVLLDKTFSAMSALGCGDVDIVIGETGWPSLGDGGNLVATVDNALSYNGNLVREIVSGKGTPLMPNRRFEAYIFALFNENQKTGPLAERNWGLFRPDFSPVYDAGVLRNGQPLPTPTQQGTNPVASGKRFCVPKPGVSDAQLQSNLDYACGQGANCSPIQPGGPCAEPVTVRSRATFAMNSYFQIKGLVDSACDFSGTAQITTVDPSYGNCHYL